MPSPKKDPILKVVEGFKALSPDQMSTALAFCRSALLAQTPIKETKSIKPRKPRQKKAATQAGTAVPTE